MKRLLIIPALLLAAPAAAQQAEPRGIEVSATGEVEVTPDQATLNFAVETTAPSSQAAAQQNTALIERVIAALVGAGVPRADIETRNFSVMPQYAADEQGDNPRISGYRVLNNVTLSTTRLDAVGRFIDVALSAGANRVQGVTFGLRDPEVAEREALRVAVTRARDAAATMAQALGVKLGPVRRATTSAGFARFSMAAAPAFAEARADVPIQPAQQTVQANVSLTFEIQF